MVLPSVVLFASRLTLPPPTYRPPPLFAAVLPLSFALPTEAYPLRKLAGNIGEDAMRELLILQSILRPESPHAESQALFEKILADGDCLTLKTMELSGKDLMAMGAPHGKILGEILAELLDMVLQHPETNKKEILSEKAQTLLKERGLL